ncbi:VCBS repeat-containing protein [bacterium]|nr:VCBS repeat-containing protein [bacterium]
MRRHLAYLWVVLAGLFAATIACFSEERIRKMLAEDLREPRIVLDNIGVEKAVIGKVMFIGEIHEIHIDESEGQRTLMLVGEPGAWRMGLDGETEKVASYRRLLCMPNRRVRRGDLDGDGSPEFIWISERCGLLVVDARGKEVWSYKEGDPSTFAVADLDGDGADEIVALLDEEDSIAWFKNGEAPTTVKVEGANLGFELFVSDMDADGSMEIIYWGVMSGLTVRDEHGGLLLHKEMEYIQEEGTRTLLGFSYDLQLVPWPPGSDHLLVTSCERPELLVSDAAGSEADPLPKITYLVGLDGEVVATLDSPSCGNGGPGGVSVEGADGETYMAMVTDHIARASLFIWDKTAKLVYREVIDERCKAMAVLPGEEADRLLLGCGYTVWAYSLGTGQPAR